MMFNPFTNLAEMQKQWMSTVTDTAKAPQSPEQIRREWLKTLKSDELWGYHDDIVDELKRRS